MTRLGGVAAGVAGRAALGSALDLGRGRRPDWSSLILTPTNIHRLTDELARMRGAAMKMGQLLSMDTGDLLPPELTEIMSRLRGQADFMPPRQLKSVLTEAWGEGWLRKFRTFNPRPIAAASIGQVHRATLTDGRDVAVKVQYPGVAQSIDSDVANVGALVRMSGLLPRGFALGPYLTEAKAQLHQETDYLTEARHLSEHRTLLADDARFVIPAVVEDLSTQTVLTMTFLDGHPIEEAAKLPQDLRDQMAHALFDLSLKEVFDWRSVQTDPNFANYRYCRDTNRIILLDFGATRVVPTGIAASYAELVRAGRDRDAKALEQGAETLGLLNPDTPAEFRARIVALVKLGFEAALGPGLFDFADPTLSRHMQAEGLALAQDGFIPPPVPMDVLLLQRKFAGLSLLATRLGARVALRDLVDTHLG